jgi:putative ABC transport system permease protein
MWMLVVGELRRRWLEYLLGALAIALIVAALITVRAVTSAAESSVHELAHRLGRNMLVVPAGTDLAAFYDRRFGREHLPDTAPATLQASEVGEHIRSVEARLYGTTRIGGVELIVVGQDLGWPPGGDFVPVVLGPRASRATGLGAGGAFQSGSMAFSVLQVADVVPDGLDDAVFMPLSAAQRLLGRPGELSALRLGGCWCRIDVATLGRSVERILPGTRAVTVAGVLEAQKGTVATMQRYSGVLDAAGAAALAIIVAVLVTSQVRRRRKEIGLLVAVGTPPRKLFWIVTVQAVVMGMAGGALGWLLAIPAMRAISDAILGDALAAPPGLLLPSISLAALVSAVAAFAPARSAATLDPIVVLREV